MATGMALIFVSVRVDIASRNCAFWCPPKSVMNLASPMIYYPLNLAKKSKPLFLLYPNSCEASSIIDLSFASNIASASLLKNSSNPTGMIPNDLDFTHE